MIMLSRRSVSNIRMHSDWLTARFDQKAQLLSPKCCANWHQQYRQRTTAWRSDVPKLVLRGVIS